MLTAYQAKHLPLGSILEIAEATPDELPVRMTVAREIARRAVATQLELQERINELEAQVHQLKETGHDI